MAQDLNPHTSPLGRLYKKIKVIGNPVESVGIKPI
jgi:hypothetical protein